MMLLLLTYRARSSSTPSEFLILLNFRSPVMNSGVRNGLWIGTRNLSNLFKVTQFVTGGGAGGKILI